MFSSNVRLYAIAVAFLMIMTIPTIAGIDLNVSAESEEETSVADDRVWTPDIPEQVPRPAPTEQPWWEITSRDENRNRIVDSLE